MHSNNFELILENVCSKYSKIRFLWWKFSPRETRRIAINDEHDCRSSFIAPMQHELRRFLSQKCDSLSFVPDFREDFRRTDLAGMPDFLFSFFRKLLLPRFESSRIRSGTI